MIKEKISWWRGLIGEYLWWQWECERKKTKNVTKSENWLWLWKLDFYCYIVNKITEFNTHRGNMYFVHTSEDGLLSHWMYFHQESKYVCVKMVSKNSWCI